MSPRCSGLQGVNQNEKSLVRRNEEKTTQKQDSGRPKIAIDIAFIFMQNVWRGKKENTR